MKKKTSPKLNYLISLASTTHYFMTFITFIYSSQLYWSRIYTDVAVQGVCLEFAN